MIFINIDVQMNQNKRRVNIKYYQHLDAAEKCVPAGNAVARRQQRLCQTPHAPYVSVHHNVRPLIVLVIKMIVDVILNSIFIRNTNINHYV